MSNKQYYSILQFIISNDSELSAIFRRICRYYNLHGKIQDKLTYSNLSINSRNQLKTAFNSYSVKNNHVDLKVFFESMSFNPTDKVEWLDHIFEITGVVKKSVIGEGVEKKKAIKLKLKRLEINFPELRNIIEYIKENKFLEKETEETLIDALKIIDFLHSNKKLIDFSELGSAVLGDSKIIREGTGLFTLVFKLLSSEIDEFNMTQYNQLNEYSTNPKNLYEKYNIISNPTAIKVTVYAPIVYYKKGVRFDFIKKLWEAGESATLSLDNLKGIDNIQIEVPQEVHARSVLKINNRAAAPVSSLNEHKKVINYNLSEKMQILTCENESPFNSLIRKNRDYAVIFTSGYPNSAVKKLLSLLKEKREFALLHWGDSDFDGLYIASIINRIIPVKLFRCDLQTLKSRRKKLIKINDQQISYRIQKFLIKNPEFVFKNELLFTIKNGWLEQENWSK